MYHPRLQLFLASTPHQNMDPTTRQAARLLDRFSGLAEVGNRAGHVSIVVSMQSISANTLYTLALSARLPPPVDNALLEAISIMTWEDRLISLVLETPVQYQLLPESMSFKPIK